MNLGKTLFISLISVSLLFSCSEKEKKNQDTNTIENTDKEEEVEVEKEVEKEDISKKLIGSWTTEDYAQMNNLEIKEDGSFEYVMGTDVSEGKWTVKENTLTIFDVEHTVVFLEEKKIVLDDGESKVTYMMN